MNGTGARERAREGELVLSEWPDLRPATPADRRALAAIVVAAVAVDAGVRSGVLGVGGALVFVASAGGVFASRRLANRPAAALVAVGGGFGAALALRASEPVVALDLLAAVACLALGVSFARGGDPLDLTVPRLAGRAAVVAAHAVLAPGFALARAGGGGRRLPAVRGVALAVPVVGVVVALLSSADAVFASLVDVPDVGDAVLHGVLLLLGAWWAAALLRTASAPAPSFPPGPSVRLGGPETATVLAGLAAVLGVFSLTQAFVGVRGASYVERTAGLSYADYARSGFFQLLAVSFVSLAVLWGLRSSTVRRAQVSLALAVVAGNLVVVAVAVRRLFLYEDAYGLTLLRLAALAAALWLGIVLVATAVAIARPGLSGRQWLLPLALGAAGVILAAANVVNVEALVVERNVDRFAGTGTLDVAYLVGLSDDAVPALVDRLSELSPVEVDIVTGSLCSRPPERGSWLEANVARHRAEVALSSLCDGDAGSATIEG